MGPSRTGLAVGIAAVFTAYACVGCTPAFEPGAAPREKVVGGRADSRFPAVGAIISDGDAGCTATVFACGDGSERRMGYAITAAHCFEESVETTYLGIVPRGEPVAWDAVSEAVKDPNAAVNDGVLVQSEDSPVVLFQVESIAMHPNYAADLQQSKRGTTEMHPYDDVAVLTLAACPMDVVPDLQPIPLVDSALAPQAGSPLVLAGWGQLLPNKPGAPDRLRSIDLMLTRRYATTFGYLANASANDGRAAMVCNGDSGGPALIGDEAHGFRVAGVTSWGDGDCKIYGISTDVASYLSFVNAVVARQEPTGGMTDPCREKVNSVLLTIPKEPEDEDPEEGEEGEQEPEPTPISDRCAYLNGICEPGCESDTDESEGDADCFHEPFECRPPELVDE